MNFTKKRDFVEGAAASALRQRRREETIQRDLMPIIAMPTPKKCASALSDGGTTVAIAPSLATMVQHLAEAIRRKIDYCCDISSNDMIFKSFYPF